MATAARILGRTKIDNISKILCAVDGSRSSDKAVDYAIGFAKAIGASVTFVTVNTVSNKDIAEHYTTFNSLVAGVADAQLHNVIKHASTQAEKAGLTQTDFVILHGREIAKTLIKFAEAKKYDQIVCGSVGLTGISRLLIGSVAERIVQLAHCPVVIVR